MSRTVKILDHREEHSPLKPIALEPLPERPLVSILISNYKYAAYLNDAIDSSLQQTYDRFEVIICDDGSTDASPRILQQYQLLDPRIRVLLQPNGGQSLALNAAFGESKGEIICLLDADDVFMPDKLQRLVSAFAAAPEAGLAVNRMLIVDGPESVWVRFRSSTSSLRDGRVLHCAWVLPIFCLQYPPARVYLCAAQWRKLFSPFLPISKLAPMVSYRS